MNTNATVTSILCSFPEWASDRVAALFATYEPHRKEEQWKLTFWKNATLKIMTGLRTIALRKADIERIYTRETAPMRPTKFNRVLRALVESGVLQTVSDFTRQIEEEHRTPSSLAWLFHHTVKRPVQWAWNQIAVKEDRVPDADSWNLAPDTILVAPEIVSELCGRMFVWGCDREDPGCLVTTRELKDVLSSWQWAVDDQQLSLLLHCLEASHRAVLLPSKSNQFGTAAGDPQNLVVKFLQHPGVDPDVSAFDWAMLSIRVTENRLEERTKVLQQRAAEIDLEVRDRVRKNDRQGALRLLSTKKRYLASVNDMGQQQHNLELQRLSLMRARDNLQIAAALSEANDAHKQLAVPVDDIEKVTESLQEQLDNAEAISSALVAAAGRDEVLADDELLAELELLSLEESVTPLHSASESSAVSASPAAVSKPRALQTETPAPLPPPQTTICTNRQQQRSPLASLAGM
eukprot:GILK01003419.1.p1 GENE.GILK01003419.1~~GILK01003419.1.p1  ORF type:complete len:463 (+),score=67.08 GILK01003419.1:35-1423(+)